MIDLGEIIIKNATLRLSADTIIPMNGYDCQQIFYLDGVYDDLPELQSLTSSSQRRNLVRPKAVLKIKVLPSNVPCRMEILLDGRPITAPLSVRVGSS